MALPEILGSILAVAASAFAQDFVPERKDGDHRRKRNRRTISSSLPPPYLYSKLSS